ncbi:hypothetical protein ABEX78_21525 [Priestia megaterium]
MPKKNPLDVDNTGSVERIDYNGHKKLDSNNEQTRNRIVEEDGGYMHPSETMENILLDFAGGGPNYEDFH